MKKIRTLLIEDNQLLRESITALLKKQSDITLISAIDNGEKNLVLIDKLKPNIVLLDIGSRNQNSLQVIKLIKKIFNETKIIVMDIIPLQADVLEFVQAGVSGFILKEANIVELLKTIRSVYEGAQVLPYQLTGSLFSQIVKQEFYVSGLSAINKSVRMTKREQQVIKLIADGLTNKEIAEELHVSIYTVKSHVHNILEKLALNTRIQIAKHIHSSDSNKNETDTN